MTKTLSMMNLLLRKQVRSSNLAVSGMDSNNRVDLSSGS